MKTRMPTYGAVPVALLAEPELTLSDLKVYTALSSFQGVHDEAFPSRDKIAERCSLAVETVSRSVAHLLELGWIERDQRGQNKTNVYRVMVEVSEVTAKSHPGSDRSVTPEVTPKSHPSIEQKTHSKNPLYILETILSELNTRTGHKYKTNGSRQRLVNARIKEGYTAEDFMKVIDNKVIEWKEDQKMNKYLTPETLFSASHFDNYLNQQKPNADLTDAERDAKIEEIRRQYA